MTMLNSKRILYFTTIVYYCQALEAQCNEKQTVENDNNENYMHFTNYSGNIDSNGKACGHGTVTWTSGIMYDGSWRNGTYNGKGRITWNANNNYSGLWKDGLMNDDNGTLNSDEMRINGQFRNGSPNGRVKIRYLTGYKKDDVYEGNAVDGYMTGYGYYHYSDGRKYIGNWKLNLKDSSGSLSWLEGYNFTGSWKGNRLTENGTMIVDSFPEITVVHGKFLPSKLKHIKLFSGSKCCNDYTDPTCFLLYDDGSLYRGECKDDLPHGYGWMVYDKSPFSDLSKFVGNWTYGKKHGQGQQYFNNHSVFYGKFIENEIHGTGLMLVDDKFCSKVTYKSGVVESYGKNTENLTYCHYEVLGKSLVNDETKVIKYNVDHCLELKGKYCNKESIYTGSVNKRLEKFGRGQLNFTNGGLYYGDFKYDQMHGEGVTKINHDLFTSGYMSFDKLSKGIQLNSNLTVIANEKLPDGYQIFHFHVSSGSVECFHTQTNRVRSDCFQNEPKKEVNQNYAYYGDRSFRGFGYEEIKRKRKAYTGQLTNSEEYNGWGYLWSEYDPVYIGRFLENKLNGPGIRITHSSEETKSFSLGFWELGRMSGAGISMQDNWTILGDFKVVKKIENVETFVKHMKEDNIPFLKSLETQKLGNIKTSSNR